MAPILFSISVTTAGPFSSSVTSRIRANACPGIWLSNRFRASSFRAFRERWILPRRRKLRTVIEEAMRQGDLWKDIDPELAMDMLYAPIYYRLQIGSGPLSKSFVNGLLEQAKEGLGP
jgi:Tetracyclin repressor-like, C-terminal domain